MNKLICIGVSIYSSVKEEHHQEEETARLDLGVDYITIKDFTLTECGL